MFALRGGEGLGGRALRTRSQGRVISHMRLRARPCASSDVGRQGGGGLGFKRSAKLAIDPQHFKRGQHFGLEAHGAADIGRGWDVADTKKSALPAVGTTCGCRQGREMGRQGRQGGSLFCRGCSALSRATSPARWPGPDWLEPSRPAVVRRPSPGPTAGCWLWRTWPPKTGVWLRACGGQSGSWFLRSGPVWVGAALQGGHGLTVRGPVNKTSVFCKDGALLDGLQKLCQKAFQRTKKNLQTHGACRLWLGPGVLSLAATSAPIGATGWLAPTWRWPLAR